MYRTLAIGGAAAALVIGAGALLAGGEAPTPRLAEPPPRSLRPGPLTVPDPVRHVAWPTPYPRLNTAPDDTAYLQATASGNPASGGYGMVRDGGSRYHEGIDIRPVARDRRGEPTDSVSAALAGRVTYVNSRANGAYGRYVVMEHHVTGGLLLYTLYAHLAALEPKLREGTDIPEGTRLGLMGRSDGKNGFPRERAHLHFEIGMRLSDNFNRWYASKRYPDPNAHDNYNGINLGGLDPMAFFRLVRENEGAITSSALIRWVKSQPVTVVAEIPARPGRLPDFLKRNPALLTVKPATPHPAGWRIGFTAYGTPVSWEPLTAAPPSARVVLVDGPLANEARRRGMIAAGSAKRGRTTPGSALETALALLSE